MYKFFECPKPDFEKLRQIADTPMGSKSGKKAGDILGFAGAFGFYLPTVYVSDGIHTILEQFPEYSDSLQQCLRRIYKNDYGEITWLEKDSNTEQRYLAGTSWGIIARYDTEHGTVCFEGFENFSLLYRPEEDITAIQKKYKSLWL